MKKINKKTLRNFTLKAIRKSQTFKIIGGNNSNAGQIENKGIEIETSND